MCKNKISIATNIQVCGMWKTTERHVFSLTRLFAVWVWCRTWSRFSTCVVVASSNRPSWTGRSSSSPAGTSTCLIKSTWSDLSLPPPPPLRVRLWFWTKSTECIIYFFIWWLFVKANRSLRI